MRLALPRKSEVLPGRSCEVLLNKSLEELLRTAQGPTRRVVQQLQMPLSLGLMRTEQGQTRTELVRKHTEIEELPRRIAPDIDLQRSSKDGRPPQGRSISPWVMAPGAMVWTC